MSSGTRTYIGAVLIIAGALFVRMGERPLLSWWHARTPPVTVWTAEDDVEPLRPTALAFVPARGFGSGERVELTAEGHLLLDGRRWLELTDRQLQDQKGATVATIDDHGRFRGPSIQGVAFSGSDLVHDDGTTIALNARGVITATTPLIRGRLNEKKVIGRVDGVIDTPAKRRAALLVASVAIARPPPPPTSD